MTRRRPLGPERLADQGIGPGQEESAARAILGLLSDDVVRDQIDVIATWRRGREDAPEDGFYEVWSEGGRVRFRRHAAEGGGLEFEVIEVIVPPMENPEKPILAGSTSACCSRKVMARRAARERRNQFELRGLAMGSIV